MRSLLVSERFGPTFQGEGPWAGHPADFLRLGGCNLDCSWCDTPYTWDWTRYDRKEEVTRVPMDDLLKWALRSDAPDLLVITGGEPLIQKTGLTHLVEHIGQSRHVQFETNGTLPPLDLGGPTYVVSPKLDHSGVDPGKALKLSVLRQFAEADSWLKFVVDATGNIPVQMQTIANIAHATGWNREDVWIMPEGRDNVLLEEGMRRLADHALEHGFCLSGRMHVSIWGDERGR